MRIVRVIAFTLLHGALQATAAESVAISIVSGNYQFAAVQSFPVAFLQPLKVRVVDESGSPISNRQVRFSVSSLAGDIVTEGGPEYLVATDQSGIATLSGLVGKSGKGFFNVTANVTPATSPPAVFLLSQNPSPVCVLPGPVVETSTELVSTHNPSPAQVGGAIEVQAVSRHQGSTLPVSHGVIGVMDADTVVLSKSVPNERTGAIAGTLSLLPGVHILKARYLADCEYRASESEPIPQSMPSGLRPSLDYTDMWWKSTESGWGLSAIQHASGQLFVVWYHYRTDGTPQWLVIPGGVWTSSTSFTGAIYRTSGPSYAGVFDPSRVSVMPVGVATFAFPNASQGTFTWTMDGMQGFRSVTRQTF